MRTRLRRIPNGFVLTSAALLFLTAGGLSARALALGIGNVELPADIGRLGLFIEPSSEAPVVSREAALEGAARATPHIPIDGASRDAYLLQVTDPNWIETRVPITERLVWLVRYSGLSLYFPGPIAADGSDTGGHTARFMYVTIDAVTGEALDIQYWE